MIAHIFGKLDQIFNQNCIVLTPGGVGYLIYLPAHTFANLPSMGENVSFYTAFAAREDTQELFGFETFAERQTFVTLRGINKIGPRSALAILSAYRPEELENIVHEENQAAITKIPGIGPKTAQHLLLELRYKLAGIGKNKMRANTAAPSARSDALAALENLGYAENECAPIVRSLFAAEPDLDAASAIRMALKELAKGKA